MLTTVVGSFPVPPWLPAMPTPGSLEDAVAVALKAQELAGVDVISDGEITRWDLQRNAPGGMVERFVRPMENVSCDLTADQLRRFAQKAGTKYRKGPPGVVTGEVGAGRLNLPAEWARVRGLTRGRLKFTVTSPYMLAKVVMDDHYGDVGALANAFAGVLAEQVREIDAAVLQVDEPTLPGSPQDGAIAAEATNRVLAAAQAGTEKAVHLCFGNYGGQRIQQGEYGRLLEYFGLLECDHLVLETTRRHSEEIARLAEVDARKKFGAGVIDVKDLQVESPKQVAQRIEAFVAVVGTERVAYVNPDCGLQHLPRDVAVGKLKALVAGRDLVVGR